MSGLLKILHPDGQWTKEELTEYVELALEGRRRIKEQLKKRGLFEFYKTHFSYIDLETDTERSVGVPEQGGALRVLVPDSNKAQFAGLSEDVIDRLDVVFYGDADRAVLKALEEM